jgi:hypothetical protein
MITFKQYLNEAPAAASASRLPTDVGRALNTSVRVAHNLNYITSAKWRLMRGKAAYWSSDNLRLAMNTLSPPLRSTAVVFVLDVVDTRPLGVPSPLSKDQLPFDAVVIVEPINGDMIAVPSLRQPLKSTFSNGRGGRSDAFRIDAIVKAATRNIVHYARHHHSARRG